MAKPKSDELDKVIGRNIAIHRRRRNMTRAALGDAISVTFQQIQKYENGANRVAASRLYRISQVLGVDIASMFEVEESLAG
jgi:transcriptional regulator with XRE-family HTH domain